MYVCMYGNIIHQIQHLVPGTCHGARNPSALPKVPEIGPASLMQGFSGLRKFGGPGNASALIKRVSQVEWDRAIIPGIWEAQGGETLRFLQGGEIAMFLLPGPGTQSDFKACLHCTQLDRPAKKKKKKKKKKQG